MATANLLQTSVSGGTQNALALQGDGVFFTKASTASRLALTLTTTDKGFVVYDTTDSNIYFWNGTAWESIPGSGDAGANGSVQYNDNGTVSGATNFVWDKANSRVGIGTASPAYILDISGASPRLRINDNGTGSSLIDIQNGAGTLYVGRENSTGSGGLSGVPYAGIMYLQGGYPLIFGTNFVERYRIDATGVATWSVAGSTAMTLNSTGLNVASKVAINGAALTYDLNVRASTSNIGNTAFVFEQSNGTPIFTLRDNGTALFQGDIRIGNTVSNVSPTAPNRTIAMSVNGVTLYIAAKTTND